jgi:ubiquinone/menaquinone biosynthesis C-methylase UbiE
MNHFKQIYTQRAAAYHRLIIPEDVDGNLRPALEQVTTFHNKRILDLGTGTGRLPLLLSSQAAEIVGLDLHAAMLQENQKQRDQVGGQWDLLQGDMRALPLPTAWAEVITAGWSIGHLTGWYPGREAWQTEIGRILAEMHRVVAPGGVLIIIETLTTGSLSPRPPSPALADYYAWLEREWGFTRQEIRTDFQFESVADAVAHTEFFFGQELAAAIRERGWSRLPEWTGIWGKHV